MPDKLKNVPWDEIRDAYLLGESSVSIGKRYKMNPSTIRCYASREKWMTPRNVKQRLAKEITKTKAAELRGHLTSEEAAQRIGDIKNVRDTLQARQQEHRAKIEDIVGSKIKSHKLPAIKTWRDLDTADRIQRRALEMDKDTPNAVVNVGVLSGGAIVEDDVEES